MNKQSMAQASSKYPHIFGVIERKGPGSQVTVVDISVACGVTMNYARQCLNYMVDIGELSKIEGKGRGQKTKYYIPDPYTK